MKLIEYLPTNEAWTQVAGIEQVGAAKHLLNAIRIRRDKEREQNENYPIRAGDGFDLRQDIVYRMGFISALNWILELPRKARDQINNLPEGE